MSIDAQAYAGIGYKLNTSYFIFYWDCEPYAESIKRVDTKKEAEQAALEIIKKGGHLTRIIHGKLVDFDCKCLINVV